MLVNTQSSTVASGYAACSALVAETREGPEKGILEGVLGCGYRWSP